ncbi:MAG TPA: MFS transporter [Gemmatimonadaceae bacterium]|jgi:ACS family tartrate transporter-like MFS transporter
MTSTKPTPATTRFDARSTQTEPISEIEQRTMRKVSVRLLPLLFVLYIASYLDRTNVGMAALQMNKQIGLSAAAYAFGASIFFIGYALFEVPSNIILARVGARRWIARIAITWGILSCAMLLARGQWSFYALRFLLGVAEAGYFPGIVFYLSAWYPERRRARAISRFMIGIPLASIIGGPLGGLLLGLNGHFGLSGWQWLFLVEGLPAVIMGIVVLVYLTEKPSEAKWLDADEKAWLASKLAQEERREGTKERGILETLRNPTVLLLAIPYFVTLLCGLSINFWAPTIMKDSLHLTNQQVGFVMGLIGVAGMTGMLLNGWHSDRTDERLKHVAVPIFIAALGMALAGLTGNPVFVVVGMAMVVFGHNTMLPVYWCLPSSFLRGAGVAAGIGLINSIGNLGGFVGPNLVGTVKTATGGYSMAFLMLSALALIASMITFSLRRSKTLTVSS